MTEAYRSVGTGWLGALLLAGSLALFGANSAAAQPIGNPSTTIEPSALTRARDLTSWHVVDKISTLRVEPHWIGSSDRFWYLRQIGAKKSFFVVDAQTGAKRPAFDHNKLLAALNRAAHNKLTELAFDAILFSPDGGSVEFGYDGSLWSCEVDGTLCRRGAKDPNRPGFVVSPDQTKAVRLDGNNLRMTDVATGRERALTTDGIDEDAYARDYGNDADTVAEERSGVPVAPNLLWSPDSRYILTGKSDERGVGTMPLIEYLTGEKDLHPKVYHYQLNMPGEKNAPHSVLVLIDTKTGHILPLPQSMQPTSLGQRFGLDLIWWSDPRTAYFIVNDRPFKSVTLYRLDAMSGNSTVVLSESSKTFLSMGQAEDHSITSFGRTARVIPETGEILWYSERDGWGHLYLYDKTGRLENRVTSGDWMVDEIIHIDANARQVYFTAGGREPGRNPYYSHLYRVNFDGSGLTLLTPENADHAIFEDNRDDGIWSKPQAFSPSGRYFVDTFASLDTAPVSVIRTAGGKLVAKFDEADISYLTSRMPVPPLAFSVKARDGTTDLFGAIFRPSNFDPSKRYPVVDYIYPGPFNTWTPRSIMDKWVFCEAQSLSELGFVVIIVDGMGSAGRSKAFQDVAYDNLQDAGLPDHVATLHQLAARYPWIDSTHVGILGISSGGFAAASALLRYPDVYSVGVSAAGIYDMRIGVAGWTEKFQGLPEGTDQAPSNYKPFILANLADRLQGKLMIVFGNLDENVNPTVTARFIDALEKAGKPYDLVLMVDHNHGFATTPYYAQRYWSYFVENLQGKTVPFSFKLD